MAAQTTKPAGRKPDNRRYDRKRVVRLAELGVPPSLIAKDQDVAISTVTRYLDKVAPQLRDIAKYTTIKADTLALSQLRKQTVEDMIVSHWLDNPELILSQDIPRQKDIIHTMQGGRYYDQQMERLERGQSTTNISEIIGVIHEIKLSRSGGSGRASDQDEGIIDVDSADNVDR